MNYTFYETAMLFFAYSFLAWLAETSVATIKEKDFRNRGFASGPFCFIYGFTGIILSVFMQELKEDTFFLFLGSMSVATAIEWFAGKALERMKQNKWWDYSGKKWNFDGYICLQYSLLWGLCGVLAVRYTNSFIIGLYNILPGFAGKAVVWGLIAIAFVDLSGSVMAICHTGQKFTHLPALNYKLRKWTLQFASRVSLHIENRIGRAYPSVVPANPDMPGVNGKPAEKCSFTELFWLLITGAFLVDITETIFCRVTAGVWMRRSSLVWGHFSLVWGFAIALLTALLYKDRDKQEHYIFWAGVFLGGAYEYICSVFTEIIFGKVFWDYSHMQFNLGGRINLLYCFFWGIAAVVWIKGLYPLMSRFINIILEKTGRLLTIFLIIFISFDICVSVMALIRYDTRADGKEAGYKWEQTMDRHFGDARMKKIYPNAIQK